MSANKKIKFAIVGLGHIGKRHANVILKHPDAQLSAVCDILPPEKCGYSNTTITYYNNLSELLQNEPEIDVVNVATPNGVHAKQCIEALEHGKHVVCEKPMGLNRAECETMIHTSLQKGKHIFVVMQNRYSPPAQLLKDVVSKKRLGTIYFVQINCYWNRNDSYYKNSNWKGNLDLDGGILFTQFSHFIDMMYWLFGDISNINARFANNNHKNSTDFEDSGTITFDFAKQGMGNINFSTAVWNKNMESSMTVIGKKGSIKVGGQYMDKVEYCHIENYKLPELAPTAPANDYGQYKGSANNHPFVIENVIDVLNNNGSATTNALEGMKVVEIIERIYQQRPRKIYRK